MAYKSLTADKEEQAKGVNWNFTRRMKKEIQFLDIQP